MERISFKMLTLLASLVWAAGSSAEYKAPVGANMSEQKYSIISRDVTVQAGDTLASIAKREMGRAGLAPLLAEHNRIGQNEQLTPGTVVRIPIQVPPRGEFAEVVFVKGRVTATRTLDAAPRVAQVSTFAVNDPMGVVYARQKTEVVELARNDRVFAGDLLTVSEEGFASVAFSSGSVINLQPGTAARIDRLTCLETDDSCLIDISAQSGRITSDVEHRSGQNTEFNIDTPYASAAVRGTVFDIKVDENLVLGVTEGSVDISAQDQSVPLPTGYGVVVPDAGPPGDPIELIPAPVFKRVPARMVVGDTIEWWPFNDAANYKVSVSLDEAGNQPVNGFDLPQDTALVDLQATLDGSIDVGDYFFTLRAVDTNGLLGFTSNTRVTLAQIDPDLQATTTSVVREGLEFLVSVDNKQEEALGYEIQISADEAFSDPLSVDVNKSGSAVFRINEDQVFTRARVLADTYTVSAFGEPTTN